MSPNTNWPNDYAWTSNLCQKIPYLRICEVIYYKPLLLNLSFAAQAQIESLDTGDSDPLDEAKLKRIILNFEKKSTKNQVRPVRNGCF